MGIIKEMHGDIEQEAIHLLARYRDALMIEAISLTSGDIHAAEELVLQAFEVHLFNRERYNSSKGGLLPWLKGIMRNMHGKAVRDKATRSIAYLSPEELEVLSDIRAQSKSTDEEVESNSDAEIVRDAIARLPESARSVIVLHYFESLSIRQIAGMLCKSQDSVRSNLYYARKVLAKRLGKMLGRASLAVGALLVGSSLLYAAAVMTGLVSPLFTGTDPALAMGTDHAPAMGTDPAPAMGTDPASAEPMNHETQGDSPQVGGDRPQEKQVESEVFSDKTEVNAMNTTTNAVTWESSVKAAAVKALASSALAVTAVFGAAPAAQGAGEPSITFKGDTITVTVPEGTVATNASLYLCWGALNAGEAVPAWSHSTCLADGTVTATGGVWTVSAAEKGVFAAMRAIVSVTRPYKAVEYVECTTGISGGGGETATHKTLQVNTGVKAKTGLRVKTRMMWLALGDVGFCGGRMTSSGGGDANRIFPVYTNANKWYLGYGSTMVNDVACVINQIYEVEAKLYRGQQTLVVDDTVVSESNSDVDVDTGGPCSVFGAYYAANALNPYSCQAHARCYYLKMWENGNTTDNPDGDLVRDFVPVKAPDGHGALYDKVSGLVFEAAYFGDSPAEYLGVGAETGETYNLSTYSASAAVSYYLPSVAFEGDSVAVTVPSAGVASPCGIVLCWGDASGGDTIASWSHSFVLTTNGLTSAGGKFSVPAATLGLTSGQHVRAFVVPGEVRRVEYVGSENTIWGTGTRTIYVDTGVDARSGLRVEAELEWLTLSDSEFCGGRSKGGTGDNSRIFPVHTYNGYWYQGYGATGTTTSFESSISTRYQVDARLYDGLQRLKVIDVSAATTNTVNDESTSGEVDAGGACGLFSAYYSGLSSPSLPSRARCYWTKLYENGNTTDNLDGTLVRDFVPAKDYYGRGVLFDRLNRKVYQPKCILNNLTAVAYATCGAETGESLVALQAETVAGSSTVRIYVPETVVASVAPGRVNVTVPPGAVAGETNALVVCWGDSDYGDMAADWPNVLAKQVFVGQAGGSFAFSTKEVAAGSTIRAFLVGTMGFADYISSEDNAGNKNVTVYLDTGVKMKHGLRVVTRIEWNDSFGDRGFIGARYDANNTRLFPIYAYQNQNWSIGYGLGNHNRAAFSLNTPYEVESREYVGEQRLTVDGVEIYSGTSDWAPDYDYNIYAFAVNWHSPRKADYGCRAKCYYLKMYTGGDSTTNPNGTLARDYVPAVLRGVAGMYDRLDGSFTASAGTGAFQYGAITNVTGYVQTTLCASPSAEMIGSGFLVIVK